MPTLPRLWGEVWIFFWTCFKFFCYGYFLCGAFRTTFKMAPVAISGSSLGCLQPHLYRRALSA